MYTFNYHRPTSLDEAVKAFSDGASLLAGGQTLIPVLKLRLAEHTSLVDLSAIPGLDEVSRKGDILSIGAMATHASVAESEDVKKAIPGLATLAGHIGDPHVRHRGTIGGSVANNDPAADYPAALLALGATIHTTKREISADDFFTGLFSTALQDGEIITKVSFPVPEKFAYVKLANRASRFALVGVAVAKTKDGIRVAATGAGADGVFRVKEIEEVLSNGYSATGLDGVTLDPKGMSNDMHADAEYRAHLVITLAKRAVSESA